MCWIVRQPGNLHALVTSFPHFPRSRSAGQVGSAIFSISVCWASRMGWVLCEQNNSLHPPGTEKWKWNSTCSSMEVQLRCSLVGGGGGLLACSPQPPGSQVPGGDLPSQMCITSDICYIYSRFLKYFIRAMDYMRIHTCNVCSCVHWNVRPDNQPSEGLCPASCLSLEALCALLWPCDTQGKCLFDSGNSVLIIAFLSFISLPPMYVPLNNNKWNQSMFCHFIFMLIAIGFFAICNYFKISTLVYFLC